MTRLIAAIVLLFVLVTNDARAQTCSGLTNIANGTSADATAVMNNFNTLLGCITAQNAPRGYLSGLTLSTAGSSVSFGIAPGFATASDNVSPMTFTASSFTKNTSGWQVGSGNGALDTTPIQASHWYHVYLIKRTDTNVVDVLISLATNTAPLLPSPYTLYRRIGSMLTDGSSNWVAFTQSGDEFLWKTPALDQNNGHPGTTATYPLTTPPGVNTHALITVLYSNTSANAQGIIYSPDAGTQAPSTPSGYLNFFSNAAGSFSVANLSVRTDLTSQVNAAFALGTGNSIYINTYGWIDRRGQNN